MPYGSNGVLQGLQGIKDSGNAYLPPLNKFMSLCRNGGESVSGFGDSFSEQLHGGRSKPTPNGVPLCWTVGDYSFEELMASGHPEDAERARSLECFKE